MIRVIIIYLFIYLHYILFFLWTFFIFVPLANVMWFLIILFYSHIHQYNNILNFITCQIITPLWYLSNLPSKNYFLHNFFINNAWSVTQCWVGWMLCDVDQLLSIFDWIIIWIMIWIKCYYFASNLFENFLRHFTGVVGMKKIIKELK